MSNEHTSPKRSRLWLTRTIVVLIIILLAVIIINQQYLESKNKEMIGLIINSEMIKNTYQYLNNESEEMIGVIGNDENNLLMGKMVLLITRNLEDLSKIALGVFGLIAFVFSRVLGSSGSTTYNNKNTTVRPNYSSNTNDSANSRDNATNKTNQTQIPRYNYTNDSANSRDNATNTNNQTRSPRRYESGTSNRIDSLRETAPGRETGTQDEEPMILALVDIVRYYWGIVVALFRFVGRLFIGKNNNKK